MSDWSLISRRGFLRNAAIVTAATTLAACAPKATPAPAAEPTKAAPEAEQPAAEQPAAEQPAAEQPAEAVPAAKERIPIQYWLFWNQPSVCEEAWRATDEWKQMEADGLDIEFRTGAGGDAGKTAVAAGTPPDVGCLGPQLDFALGGVLLDLNPFVEASDKISPDIFFTESYENASWQDMQFGIPAMECYVRLGLDYNERLVGEAGLDPDQPPTTFDELFEWHEKLTKFDAAGNLIQFGIDPDDAMGGSTPHYASGWTLACLWDMNDWWNPTDGTININQPRFVEALGVYAEFIKLMGVDNLTGLRSVEGQGTWGGSYNAEVQAMIIEGYWHPGETAKEKPEVAAVNRASWVPVPAWRAGDKVQLYTAHATSLYRDGPHAKEAFPVMEFQQCKAHLDILFDAIGWLPALKDYVANVEPIFPGLDFYLQSAAAATHKYTDPRMPISTFVEQKIIAFREKVYREELTAQQAADEIQAAVEQEWEESGWKDRWGQS